MQIKIILKLFGEYSRTFGNISYYSSEVVFVSSRSDINLAFIDVPSKNYCNTCFDVLKELIYKIIN